MTPLVQLSQYLESVPCGVNSSYDAVGGAFDYPQGGFPNPEQIALEFLPTGSIVRIGGLDNGAAYARGINDSGVIVGSDGATPFVNYTGAPGANTALGSLISPGSGAGWTLYYAYGIDDNGDIVGQGAINSVGNGYLLTPVPVPEPSTLVLTVGGLMGLLAYAWRKRRQTGH